MKLSQKLNLSVLGLALACAASGSSALTLGRASGAAILGRPLDVTVAVQFGADEDTTGICFEADVFYGDSRQDASRVTVSSETPSQGAPLKVRVSAYTPVDEPIVTVYLRAACGRQATRRYVLLADLVSDLVPSVVALPVARSTLNVPAIEVPAPKVSSRSVAPTGASSAFGAAVEKSPAVAKTHTVKAINRPSTDLAATPVSRRARLKLAPIDFTQDLDPTLKISSELPFLPLEDLKKRSEAIALWRSLNASPEDVLRDGLRMQSMESDLKALQDVTLKNRQVMQDLMGRLDRAEAQRYANPLVYGLAALLLVFGVGLAYVISRLRAARLGPMPWWRGPNAGEKPEEPNVADIDVCRSEAFESNLMTQADVVPEPMPVAGLYEVDIDLHLADSAFADLGKPMPVALKESTASASLLSAADLSSRSDFSQSVFGTFREIGTEEMLDVRQQADFFMTLGQYDEAIDVLEVRIKAGGEVNPLLYLDLLKVFHTLSKKAEYDNYRSQFNEFFSGNVPAYAMFNQQGNHLDVYPDICSRIVELWPTPEAVAYIEHCLVRAPGGDLSSGFDLEAFRDLLMLHGVVRRLVSSSDSGLIPFSALKSDASPIEKLVPLPLPVTSPVFGAVPHSAELLDIPLDFDLSEPSNNLIEFDGVSFSAPFTPK